MPLTRSQLPKLHRHMVYLRCDISVVATDWFLCLFCTSLPSEVAARVWDALFHESSKILFRMALAVLRRLETLRSGVATWRSRAAFITLERLHLSGPS